MQVQPTTLKQKPPCYTRFSSSNLYLQRYLNLSNHSKGHQAIKQPLRKFDLLECALVSRLVSKPTSNLHKAKYNDVCMRYLLALYVLGFRLSTANPCFSPVPPPPGGVWGRVHSPISQERKMYAKVPDAKSRKGQTPNIPIREINVNLIIEADRLISNDSSFLGIMNNKLSINMCNCT